MAAMSFTPDELFTAVKKHVPHLQISYKVDARQKIGKKSSETFNCIYFDKIKERRP